MERIIHNLEKTFAQLWKTPPKGPLIDYHTGDLVMHDWGVKKDDGKPISPPIGVHTFLLSKKDAMGNDLLDEYLKLGMELSFIGRKHYSMRVNDIKWGYSIAEKVHEGKTCRMLVIKYDNDLVHFEHSINGDIEITSTGHIEKSYAERLLSMFEAFKTTVDDTMNKPYNMATERKR